MAAFTASSVSFTSLSVSLSQSKGFSRGSVSLPAKAKSFGPLTLRNAPLRFRVSCAYIFLKWLLTGVCHSDHHMMKNNWDFTNYPIIPGLTGVGKRFIKTVPEIV